MVYDLVMITPLINRECINEFLNSLKINQTLKVFVLLVDMSMEDDNLNFSEFDKDFVEFVYLKQEKKHGSSVARNIALKFLFEKSNLDFKYLMYPDDDTTFDSAFFLNFEKYVAGDGVYIDTRCKGTAIRYITDKIKEGMVLRRSNDFKYIGCVSFVFSRNLIYKIGFFDERLGAGEKYGACEDGDYFIRSLEFANLIYKESIYTYHPAPKVKYSKMSLKALVKRFSSYSRGGMFLFCKHKMFYEALVMITRGLLGSVLSLVKFQFKLSYVYFRAFLVRVEYFIILSITGISEKTKQ